MAEEKGTKKRVEDVLRTNPAMVMTMGQIMTRGDIDKTLASDVSSALHKLRTDGLVKAVRGPSTSTKGPRFVRLYQWAVKTKPVRVEALTPNPLAGLGMFRI